MSKRSLNISSVEDLQMEERRVRKRLKKQEAELMGRAKQLPEEVITVAAVKLISGLVQGGALKTIVSLAKKVGKNVFSALMKEDQ